MSDTPAASPDALAEHVRAVRDSGVLARSSHLNRLFDFLYRCHQAGRVPKEFEIAVEGLGRDAGFDASQDALVRVYVHKLRRKLDEHYREAVTPDGCRLSIPKGEYRLLLQTVPPEDTSSPDDKPATLRRFRWTRPAVLGAALAVSLALNLLLWLGMPAAGSDARLRASALWQPLFADERPVVVVVGDYYVFAETDGGEAVKRLVRDFEINSPGELAGQLQLHPARAEQQFDVGLSYLPTGTAHAVAKLAPILAAGRKTPWGVILASELTPENLRNSHLVFIGHLSGLGMLEPLLFEHAGFRLGRGYDELVDKASGRRYQSSSGIPHEAGGNASHLAYLASFAGPTGNRILVVAGCRDAGLRELADRLASPEGMAELVGDGDRTGGAFEALYQTSGFGPATTPARLLLRRALEDTPKALPDGR